MASQQISLAKSRPCLLQAAATDVVQNVIQIHLVAHNLLYLLLGHGAFERDTRIHINRHRERVELHFQMDFEENLEVLVLALEAAPRNVFDDR